MDLIGRTYTTGIWEGEVEMQAGIAWCEAALFDAEPMTESGALIPPIVSAALLLIAVLGATFESSKQVSFDFIRLCNCNNNVPQSSQGRVELMEALIARARSPGKNSSAVVIAARCVDYRLESLQIPPIC